jgi:hypothetical protein
MDAKQVCLAENGKQLFQTAVDDNHDASSSHTVSSIDKTVFVRFADSSDSNDSDHDRQGSTAGDDDDANDDDDDDHNHDNDNLSVTHCTLVNEKPSKRFFIQRAPARKFTIIHICVDMADHERYSCIDK